MADHIVKLRGLPWSTTAKEISEFLKDCNIAGEEKGIHLILGGDGRASGQCFVELSTEQDVETAKGHNKEELGSRYIEIFDAKRTEMAWLLERQPGSGGGMGMGMGANENSTFVKLRGLPFESTKTDIADFFAGIEIAPYGITVTMDPTGRPSGDAYVELADAAEVEKALLKNKEKIGRRYIEIFKCAKHDVKYVSTQSNSPYGGGGFNPMMGGRPGPYDRPGGFGGGGFGMSGRDRGGGGGGGMAMGPGPIGRGRSGARGGGNQVGGKPDKDCKTGHMIHMRGLPFEATQGDVYRFLAPLIPTEVRMLTEEESGKAKGECHVDFDSHSDAVEAMTKNKQNMGRRYIDIFLKSQPSNNDYQWSPGYYGGQMNQNNGQLWW